MVEHDASYRPDPVFGPEDLLNASELREFVFCERTWFLARQGYAVSCHAQAQRAAGVAFHEARAADAQKGSNRHALWWIVLLLLLAIALLLINALLESR
jgi:hypothetical protein